MKKLIYSLAIVLIASFTICNVVQAQTPITYGQTIQGSISITGEIDTFKFAGNTNDIVTMLLSGNFGYYGTTQLELYSPNGTLLKRVSGQYSTRIDSSSLPVNGLYTILVMDNDGQQTGNYGLSIQRRFNPSLATSISYGQTKDSSIAHYSQMNAYTFNASSNDIVTIMLSGNFGYYGTTQLELYSPNGTLLKRVSGQYSTRIDSSSLPVNGLYTILVMDNDGQQTGNYGLSIQRRFNPSLATSISYGQTKDSSIAHYSQMNAYTFNASSNDIVTIMLSGNFGYYGTTQLELYSPNGTLLKRVSGQYSTRIDSSSLPVNGLYTILVMDNDGQQTGNYGLSIQRRFNPSLATSISYGQTKDSSIAHYSQMNAYTFNASSNDIITIMLSGNFGYYGTTQLELYSPNGTLLKRVSGQYSARIDSSSLPVNGLYTILVMDNDGQQTGNYGLSIQRRFNPSLATSISYGQTKDSSIAHYSQMNAYTFNASSNDIITIMLSGNFGYYGTTQLELYSPNGTLLKRVSGQYSARIDSSSLPVNGLYTILVMDNDGQQTGNYGLSIQRRFNPSLATSISYGQTKDSSIAHYSQMNAYTFNASSNDIVTMLLSGNFGYYGTTQLELYSPNGTLLKRVSGQYSTRIDSSSLPVNGLYTILVMDNDGQQTGNYGLSIQRRFNPSLATSISYGQTKDSSIAHYSQMNAYTFNASSNDIVTIMLSGNFGYYGTTQLELYSPNGTLLKRVSGQYSTRIDSSSLPVNGLYTILVMDNDGQQTGNYGLSIQRRFNPSLATSISYGQTKDSSIAHYSQMNAYTFNASSNDIVTIMLSGNFGYYGTTQLELYSPNGTLLKRVSGQYSTRIDSLLLTTNGLYTILVMDNDGQQTGNYVLTLNGTSSLHTSLDLKVLIEGLYDQTLNRLGRKDTMKVYLRNVTAPYAPVDSAIGTIDTLSFTGHFSFNAPTGTYYIVVKHFNSIETWSKSGGEFLARDTIANTYDFTTSDTKAFGNNLRQVDEFPVQFAIYSGDPNQDGIVDVSDMIDTFNDVQAGTSGHVATDFTGDNFVDVSDLIITYNNANKVIGVITP